MWWKIYIGLHVQYLLLLSDFNETWKFLEIFEKSSNIKLLEIRPVGAELFRADGQTDMKPVGYFAVLRKATKDVLQLPVSCADWHSKCNWHNLKLQS